MIRKHLAQVSPLNAGVLLETHRAAPPGWRQGDAPDTILMTHAISGRALAEVMSHGDRCPKENKARPCQGKGAPSQKVTFEQTPGQRKGKAT